MKESVSCSPAIIYSRDFLYFTAVFILRHCSTLELTTQHSYYFKCLVRRHLQEETLLYQMVLNHVVPFYSALYCLILSHNIYYLIVSKQNQISSLHLCFLSLIESIYIIINPYFTTSVSPRLVEGFESPSF